MRKPSRTVYERRESVYLEQSDMNAITDFLTTVKRGIEFMESARTDADMETDLGIFTATFANTVLPKLDRVQNLHLERGAVLNPKHPDFLEACARVRGTNAAVTPQQRRSAPLLLVPARPVETPAN